MKDYHIIVYELSIPEGFFYKEIVMGVRNPIRKKKLGTFVLP